MTGEPAVAPREFVPDPARPRVLLLGEGAGIAPVVELAGTLRYLASEGFRPLVLLGAEERFPFRPRPSRILVPGMPEGVIAAAPLLEEWGIASRLASRAGLPGCHEGTAVDLAESWLRALPPEMLREVAIFARGPDGIRGAAAGLAREWALPYAGSG